MFDHRRFDLKFQALTPMLRIPHFVECQDPALAILIKMDTLSSLLLPNSDLKNLYDNRCSYRTIKVETKRFDDIIDLNNYSHSIFMKIDVQGAEKKVLEGASKQLNKIDVITIEFNFMKFYKGQASFFGFTYVSGY